MPPDVDPEQPPIAKILRKITLAKEVHLEKSSRENPVLEIIDVTLKRPMRIARSTSYPL